VAFGADCDYAVLHEVYVAATPDESRYCPATCMGCDMKTVIGKPQSRTHQQFSEKGVDYFTFSMSPGFQLLLIASSVGP
jgi:hypothetical protein